MTAKPCGMKNATAASTQSSSEDGPFAAASAIQRMPTIAATLKRTMSRVLSARSRAMRASFYFSPSMRYRSDVAERP